MCSEERLVMRHYLLHSVHVIMAFECERRNWNPWVEIHAPLAFNHLPGYVQSSQSIHERSVVHLISACPPPATPFEPLS
jgi:hypothetical protein